MSDLPDALKRPGLINPRARNSPWNLEPSLPREVDPAILARQMFNLADPVEVGLACDYLVDEGDHDLADLLRRSISPPLVQGAEQEERASWVAHDRDSIAMEAAYWPERHRDRPAWRIIVYYLPLAASSLRCLKPEERAPGWIAEMYDRNSQGLGVLRHTMGPKMASPALAVLGLVDRMRELSGDAFLHLRGDLCRSVVEEVPIRNAADRRPEWWER